MFSFLKQTKNNISYTTVIENRTEYIDLIENKKYYQLFYNLNLLFKHLFTKDISYITLLNDNLIEKKCPFKFQNSENIELSNEDISISFYDTSMRDEKPIWEFIIELKETHIFLNFEKNKKFLFQILDLKTIATVLINVYNQSFDDEEQKINNIKNKLLDKYKIMNTL